ncbi:MAG: hypothetical protein ROO71_13860 [Balneola sp.]
MTLQEAKQEYPQIDSLYSIIESKNIELTPLPKTPELSDIYFREIEFKSDGFISIIPLDDAESGNPALLLQLVIYAVEEYEAYDDFLIWCTAFGLNVSDPFILNLYKELGTIIPKVSGIIGTNINDISDYDWELNAGAAQALRELDE